MENTINPIIWWWGIWIFFSFISLPIATLLFYKSDDNGYIGSRIVTLITVGFVVWMLAFGILPFSTQTIFFTIFSLIFINLLVLFKFRTLILHIWRSNWASWIRSEILFGMGYLLWIAIRGQKPEINSLEKFMDHGFVNAILRSEYFPPADMWYAGEGINYYYFGHYLTALVTKISLIKSEITYNLMLATLVGLSMALTSVVARTIWNNSQLSEKKFQSNKLVLFLITILSIFFLVFRGNLHWGAYQLNKLINCPAATSLESCSTTTSWLPDVTKPYWYPDATRYIPFTIHEFPIYSFVVADLHAHVINIPLVLTLLLAFMSYMLVNKYSWLYLIFFGWNLGIFYMSNAWDFPIYFLIVSLGIMLKSIYSDKWHPKMIYSTLILIVLFLLIIFSSLYLWRLSSVNSRLASLVIIGSMVTFSSLIIILSKYWDKLIEVLDTWKDHSVSIFKLIIQILLILIIALVTCWQFIMNFDQIAQGVEYVNANSSIPELLTLWGWDIFIGISLISIILYQYIKSKQVSISDSLMLSWWLVGMILIITPEFIYVKDIYISDYHRANTMFKLVYQSWILFAFVSTYTIIKFIYLIRSSPNSHYWIPWLATTSLGIIIMAPYPIKAIESYYGRINDITLSLDSQEIDGILWLRDQNNNEFELLNWLIVQQGQFNIVEAVGDSYTEFNRFSAYTGLPTILGWTVHEWLWRGFYDQQRITEVDLIYTAKDLEETRQITVENSTDPSTGQKTYETITVGGVNKIIDKYQIKYIIVGQKEIEKYPNLNESLISTYSELVFESGSSKVYQVKK